MKTFFLFLMIFISSSIMAKNYNLGLKLGLTCSSSDYHHSYLEEHENLSSEELNYWGGFFSAYISVKLNDFFLLQIEGNFNQKSFKNTHTYEEVKIEFLEFATLIKLNLKYVRLYVGVFQNSVLNMNGEVKDRIYEITEEVTDIGTLLGFELYYKSYLIDFRYNQGFNRIVAILEGDDMINLAPSREFILSFGYEF